MQAQALRSRWFGPDEREQALHPRPAAARVLLLLIIAVAAFLRLYRLQELPPGFYCDEAALGYNAFSLLETGRDENGVFLPLYVWSFDTSYKNPVFVYSAVPLVALFGLDEFAVRLTSALYGTGTVAAMFFLGRALMGAWAGLLAAAFLAVCPWHVHFSRIAVELSTFPFFFVMAMTCLVQVARGGRRHFAAAILCGVCLYTYAVAKLFVPLFLLGFAALHARALLRRRRETGAALGLLILTALPVIVFDLTHREQAGHYFLGNTFLSTAQPPLAVAREFAENYAAFLSPRFLFREPDPILRHAVRNHGELYDFFAPFLLLGLLATVGRRDAPMRLPLLWLLLYPVGPALMTEVPSASRGFIGAPAFCLITALGAGLALRLAGRLSSRSSTARRLQICALGVGIIILAPQVTRYWQLYTQAYPKEAVESYAGFQFGHREVVRYFLAHRSEYDTMVVSTRNNNRPEIFLLFYGKFPPADFQTGGLDALERETGMTIGRADERFFFADRRRLLFAARAFELPLFTGYELKQEIDTPGGSPAFSIVEPEGLKDFVDNWMVTGPFPFDDASPPPEFGPDERPVTGPGGRAWYPYGTGAALIDLGSLVRSEDLWNCAWALNFVSVQRAQTVQVLAGFDVHGEVWINGAPLVLRHRGHPEELVADTWTGTARLQAGLNTVAVRSCASVDAWRFHFRLSAPDGGPVSNAVWTY